MFRFTVFVAVCACALAAVSAYAPAPIGYAPAYAPIYAPAPGPVYAPSAYAPAAYAPAAYAPAAYAPAPKALKQVIIPDIAILPDQAEAKASAQSQRVGAQATSEQINANYFNALDAYGKEIGKPLLAKDYGALTNLYAACLPARSYVGQIDPVFTKGPYGKIQHLSETSISAAAV